MAEPVLWVSEPEVNGEIRVLDPHDGSPLPGVPVATEHDVAHAVVTARELLPSWKATPAAERGAALRRVARALSERAEELAGEILRLCIQMGGSITGEHGVGVEKRAYLPEQYGDADMDVMQRLRRALDPKGIANPGKMLLVAEAPALTRHVPHPLEQQGVISRA